MSTDNFLNEIDELNDIDRNVLWHPFTQMAEYREAEPLIVACAEGCWLEDVHGKRYLDAIASLWTNVHGHCVPEIDAAVRDQLDRVAHSTLLGQANVPSIRLAKKLVEITPEGLDHVFYSDSGSTAMEIALKMAFQFHRQNGHPERRTFIGLSEAYHGDTIGSVSLGGIDLFHSVYRPLLFEMVHVPTPYNLREPRTAEDPDGLKRFMEALEAAFVTHGKEAAAFTIEPLMQGAAGMLAQPKGYLRRVRELCDEYGVLLICDEVATGFGRTGTMFACEQEGVRPDLMALAKGLSGGYLPLAATMASSRIYEGFLGSHEEARTFFHGHTFTGNPLASAAALASLELFETRQVLEKIQPKIEHFARRLDEWIAPLNCCGEIRRRGLMCGVELVKDKSTLEEYPWQEKIGARVCLKARDFGVILRPLGSVLVFMPPLAISLEEIDLMVDAARKSLVEVCGK